MDGWIDDRTNRWIDGWMDTDLVKGTFQPSPKMIKTNKMKPNACDECMCTLFHTRTYRSFDTLTINEACREHLKS